jgi:hypothetical protein
VVAKSLEELLGKRHVDREAVEARKKHLFDGVRAYRLRELREASNLARVELAARLRTSARTRWRGMDTATSTCPGRHPVEIR